MTRIAAYVAVALLAGFIAVRFLAASRDAVARQRLGPCLALSPVARDEPAPDFTLYDARGRAISLSSLRGKWVLLNFWATWCPPCVDEMPSMEKLAAELPPEDFVVLAVSADDGWEPIRKFFAQGTRMTILLDTSKTLARAYGTEKFPETYLIDRQGRIRSYFINKREWSSPPALACLRSLL